VLVSKLRSWRQRREVVVRGWHVATAILAMVVSSAGCGGSRIITLSYAPPVVASTTGPRLVILPFDDRRGDEGDEGDPYRVGGIYARYGNRLAKVMVTRPWPPQLREALAAEFRAAGVEATIADVREPGAFSLAGEVRNFSTESRLGREAHIAVILRLRNPQGQPFEKRIDVRESSGYHRDPWNTYLLEGLLNKAFAEFVKMVASDPEIRAALGPAQ
jgi:hypothetical protein